jgi:hypothetical protein
MLALGSADGEGHVQACYEPLLGAEIQTGNIIDSDGLMCLLSPLITSRHGGVAGAWFGASAAGAAAPGLLGASSG